MRLSLLVSLFFLSFQLFSQKNTETALPRRFHFGLSVSPELSYRKLIPESGLALYLEKRIRLRDSVERAQVGLSINGHGCLVLSPRFTFEVNLQYAIRGYAIEKLPDYKPYPRSYYFRQHSFEIPFLLHYRLSKRAFRPVVSVGVAPVFVLTEFYYYVEHSTSGDTQKLKAGAIDSKEKRLHILTGLGFEYQLTESIFFRAEPTFRYSLFPNKTEDATEQPYHVGLVIGAFFRI